MASSKFQSEWLSRYGNLERYQWRPSQRNGRETFRRPLGLVEFSFDSDGRHFKGRADLNCLFEVTLNTTLTGHAFRERILIALTCLRCQHLLLRAKTFQDREQHDNFAPDGLHYEVDIYSSVGKAIEDAGSQLVFLEDYYKHVDEKDFYFHCLNVGRIVDPDVTLARCFVLPGHEKGVLRMQFIIAHEICDGLTAFTWFRSFLQTLNEPEKVLRQRIAECIKPNVMERHLPLPQEALYTKVPGSPARQRWFWAITRVLRHVRKPLPVGFENPLRRSQPGKTAQTLSPVYDQVLDYTVPPLLNSYPMWIKISASNMHTLRTLCKEVNASLGAGIYALTALVTMEFHERRHPDSKEYFITGFPLDPRAFFGFHTEPDSMMLAFSDGIALPFLSSDLPLRGRLRLLARQAQRQLASYQKRAKPKGEDANVQFLTSRGAGLVLANQYLYSLERADTITPGRRAIWLDVQGEYPARMNPTVQTHGVSSVGNREALIRSGLYDLNDPNKDFAVDFLNLTSSVRPREGEFLVGIGGSSQGLFCTPSVDATNLDPLLVNKWRDRFETVLDDIDRAKL